MAQNLKGSAKVRCQIDPQGKVTKAELVETTHPAFGKAALTAIRQWRFDPAVKDHHFVAAAVIIPFDFAPPAPDDTPAAGQ